MTFDQWITIGIQQGWALPTVCATHDGMPMAPEEQAQFDIGDDPCIHAVRVCEPHQWTAIYENTNAMAWRDTEKEFE